MNETVKIKIHSETDDSPEISWQMEEPNFAPKNSDWYWALAIFGLAIVVFSIILKNYLFIIIVALVALILYSSKNKKLELINFRLDTEGLHIDNKLYHYESFKSFWIFLAQSADWRIERGSPSQAGRPAPNREIAVRYKRHLAPLLIAPFHNSDESQIRKILSGHLDENEEEESLIDLLRKRFF